MSKVQKRIVRQVFPNSHIREWHTTHQINAVSGICNTIKCSPGHEPTASEWSGTQATPENSPKAFALASAIVAIPGVKEVKIDAYDVWVEIFDAFDFDRDKIAGKVTLEVRRHVYSLRQKVEVTDHDSNRRAIHERFSPPDRDDMSMY
jgi:hypothetical protein